MKTMPPTLAKAWHIFKNKGPVFQGHKSALRALQTVDGYLTEREVSNLRMAMSHAIDYGEGRSEFDGFCKLIEKRWARIWGWEK